MMKIQRLGFVGIMSGIGALRMALLALFLCSAACMLPAGALADPTANATATTDPQFDIPDVPAGQGLLSSIVRDIQTILFGSNPNPSCTNADAGIAQRMFCTITDDGGFIRAVSALMTLYIAIYGILFTFGMVQLTVYDFGIRMVKMGICVLLISPDSWTFFNSTVVTFFNQGTDEIINEVTSIAVGGITNNINPSTGTPAPFAPLDDVIAKALSAKMWVTLLAMIFTGPYGLLYGLLLALALRALIASLLTAMWVYLMSLVLRALLFGVAPIFLACMLFGRTKHLFDGWLNQVVNACLQPIFLFIFFAFFVKLMEGSIDNIITYDGPAQPPPVAWTTPAETVRGTPFDQNWWRFMIWNPNKVNPPDANGNPVPNGGYEVYGGSFTWNGPVPTQVVCATPPCPPPPQQPVFPLDLLNILIFFMLAELAGRFNTIVIQIAKDLAAASTDLSSMQGSLSEWFTPGGDKNASAVGNIGSRVGPGGRGGGGAISGARQGMIDSQRTQAAAKAGMRGNPA